MDTRKALREWLKPSDILGQTSPFQLDDQMNTAEVRRRLDSIRTGFLMELDGIHQVCERFENGRWMELNLLLLDEQLTETVEVLKKYKLKGGHQYFAHVVEVVEADIEMAKMVFAMALLTAPTTDERAIEWQSFEQVNSAFNQLWVNIRESRFFLSRLSARVRYYSILQRISKAQSSTWWDRLKQCIGIPSRRSQRKQRDRRIFERVWNDIRDENEHEHENEN